jgi:Flp pilus assembly pilin Flp
MVSAMRWRSLLFGIVVACIALSLGRALVTHDGVGPVEYTVGFALVGVLMLTTFRAMRRAIQRT